MNVASRPAVFTLQVNDDARRIAVGGEVDVATAGSLTTAVQRVQRYAPGDVVIDISAMTFIDAAGLGALAAADGVQRNLGHRLVVTGASPKTVRVFDFGRVSHLL